MISNDFFELKIMRKAGKKYDELLWYKISNIYYIV